MSDRTTHRVARALTDAMWERDQAQMRIIDRLLCPKRTARKRTRRARREPRRRR
jgi:hypothetical protein